MDFLLGLLGLLYLASPLFVWGLVHWHWRQVGKDPQTKSTTVIPQYEPFQHLPPAVLGVVYDTRANDADITATLLDWVSKKIITIKNRSQVEQRWHGKVHVYHTVDYQVTKATAGKPATWLPYEQLIWDTLFATGDNVNLNIALQRIQRKLKFIRQQLYIDAVTSGLFTQAADTWRKRYYTASRWLIAVGFVTGLFGIGIPLLLYGVILRIYSPWMAQRTALGMEAVQWCEGFKVYLHHAERFRAQRMEIETAEKILPYIMVLHLQAPAWQLELPASITEPAAVLTNLKK